MSNDTSLQLILDAKRADFNASASEEKKKVYAEGITAIVDSGLADKALNVGDIAPNFKLKNLLGESVELYDRLSQGRVILTWYRGGWCPYCNITLHHLQQELPNYNAHGASLLVLTPELPEHIDNTKEKNQLDFDILGDHGNQVAKQFNIVFQLIEEVANIYNASFDMNSHNGDQSNELPLAASYIINQDKTIAYAFIDTDYRNRAEPRELTRILAGLSEAN